MAAPVVMSFYGHLHCFPSNNKGPNVYRLLFLGQMERTESRLLVISWNVLREVVHVPVARQ